MRRIARFGLATLAALGGCAAPGQSPEDVASRGRAGAAVNPVFATQIAGPSTFLAPMPTAIVILRPDDLNRNRAFCAAFTSRLPTVREALARSVVAPNLVQTRWLVQLPEVPAERASDCDFLVGTYDYTRAARLIAAVRLDEGRLSGPGPFLVMVIPDNTGLHVAGLDGSGYASDDFARFIDAWGSALGQTQAVVSREPDQPGLIRSIFDLVSAILRTVAGVAGGVIRGIVTAL